MNDWGYVAVGWGATAAVIAGYWSWIAVRTRRAVKDIERIRDDA